MTVIVTQLKGGWTVRYTGQTGPDEIFTDLEELLKSIRYNFTGKREAWQR